MNGTNGTETKTGEGIPEAVKAQEKAKDWLGRAVSRLPYLRYKRAVVLAAGILLCTAAVFIFLFHPKPKPVYTVRVASGSDAHAQADAKTAAGMDKEKHIEIETEKSREAGNKEYESRESTNMERANGENGSGKRGKEGDGSREGGSGKGESKETGECGEKANVPRNGENSAISGQDSIREGEETEKKSGRKAGFFFWKGKLYFLKKNGCLARGWFQYNRKTYYFDPKSGASVKGWVFDNGKWYYLQKHAKFTGWHEIDGDRYCFNENGVMYENCVTPDGYYVDNDGKWVDVASEGKSTFTWNKSTARLGPLSGLYVAGRPAELYMLCIAGETSGFANAAASVMGDSGRAYGICQFDYRYDLVDFMRYAYQRHPRLWNGFEACLDLESGDPELVSNEGIAKAFLNAFRLDYETAISDQLEYMAQQCWNGTESAMNAAGFMLGRRHIAVSAAIFSINVNCGSHTALYLQELRPDMTDEEMIRALYRLRNTVMAEEKVGNSIKGTSSRYLSAEPQMALDLLYGYTTIDSHAVYGGGVEWHGNPFSSSISTIPNIGSISFATPSNASAAALSR